VPSYEIRSIALVGEPAELRGFELETPKAGEQGDLHLFRLGGWIVGRESQPVAIEVIYNARVLRTLPVKGIRSDVEQRFPEMPQGADCKFHALLGLIGLKLESELSLHAVLENGQRVRIASIDVRRRPLRSGFEPTIQPLIVTSLGRTGTTMLMKAFTSHPDILVFRHFPYEYSVAKYWLHMLRVLSEPANLGESAHPNTFQADLHWVGHNPYHDDAVHERPELASWIAGTYVEQLAAFCQSSIEQWYTTLARLQGQDAPIYFAEKMWPTYLPVLTWELYPKAKEVILVRDFRDVACSILAIDARRGEAEFGRREGKSEEDYIRDDVRRMADAMRKSWRTRSDRAHLVRYEDLVLRPGETITGLLDYLELDHSPQLVEQMLRLASEDVPQLPGTSADPRVVELHRTNSDPKDTIGRWRRESGDSRDALYWEAFGEELEEFGYSRSGLPE
jgi:sulfotransferase family protein